MTSPLGAELRRIHDSLRADLRALQAAAATGARPDVRRTLAAHCLAFCAALTAHHTGEDAGAFPALAQRFPELASVLDEMAEDHVWISGILARVEELAGELAASGTSPRLAGELDGLAAIVESHFSFEERRIAAALDRLPGPATLLVQQNSAL
ncbi:Hemerythrin HHE cation binding domain-containing protein [Geodermatophilus amargosae]|uniref:Hemerythrin HHE cation binding domain-containing protein n=1 Tax=Geodermatophilus amargosae TaxID=1296565 RepID=A0A1I7BVK1_9ACTN|nr:hemerythrin domain-containing protein [Geodermatophilus amargosae]SFT91205.1 Hemerythrin HHE cation binding domain-containing protein [Geodermatophilus amargosae]